MTSVAQPAAHRVRPGGALPPGPAESPLRQGTRFHRDPLGMTREMQTRYGDLFTLRLPTEGAVVAVCAPDAVGRLLEADPARAHTGEGRRKILGVVSPRSVLGGDGEIHRATRGRVAAVFAEDSIHRHRDAIATIAERHVAGWPRRRPFRLLPRLRALVDEVFTRAIVGAGRPEALAAAVQRMLNVPGNPPLSIPGPDDGLLGRFTAAEFERRSRPVRELLLADLRAGHAPPGTVLAAMAGLDEESALEEIVPLLMAGQEPPAAALAWLLERIARTPGLAEQVHDEPTAPETDRIRREALRLRPPVVAVMRRWLAPFAAAGAELPAGTMTMVVIPFMHRDPRVWNDAEAFRPERFAAGPPDAYLPFGGGHRRCLGEHLAHLQMDVVLPVVLGRLRLRPLWPAPERMVVRGTVLVPNRSGLMLAT
jgi:cytochrome P450 family 135